MLTSQRKVALGSHSEEKMIVRRKLGCKCLHVGPELLFVYRRLLASFIRDNCSTIILLETQGRDCTQVAEACVGKSIANGGQTQLNGMHLHTNKAFM